MDFLSLFYHLPVVLIMIFLLLEAMFCSNGKLFFNTICAEFFFEESIDEINIFIMSFIWFVQMFGKGGILKLFLTYFLKRLTILGHNQS